LVVGEVSARYRDESMFEAHRIIESVSRWIMLVLVADDGCSMRRTSFGGSREIQSMMEWFRSLDCWRDLCSISRCINVRSTSNHRVSVSRWMMIVMLVADDGCSMRRTSTPGSREIQSMMEWCRSLDCWRDLCSISRCINVRSHRIIE